MTPGALHSSKPLRYAALLAGSYVVVGIVYIVTSSQIAAAMATSVTDLEQFERMKGVAFVLVTGTLLCAIAWALFARLESSSAHLARSQEALLRAERRATPGLLAASIAHDFRNMLSVIGGSVDLLERETNGASSETLEDLRAAVRQATDLSRRLSRTGTDAASGATSSVDVAAVVGETVELLRHHPEARARTLRIDATPAQTSAFPALLQQIVTNFVVNALEATSDGGTVLVRVRGDEGQVHIEVHDDGPGVSDEVRGRLFDAFFTTKRTGTGLGLVSARQCAELHGGSVTVERSTELGGACFGVHFPLR